MKYSPKTPVYLVLDLCTFAQIKRTNEGQVGVFSTGGQLLAACLEDRENLGAVVELYERLYEVRRVDCVATQDYTLLYRYPVLQDHVRRINEFSKYLGPPS